nr:MAG TPA: endoplasmic reticulum chaperone [Caudoviricetes sp.]
MLFKNIMFRKLKKLLTYEKIKCRMCLENKTNFIN